ncbi:MAG: L-aspartate oxidase [Propionibacteriaceae bacterium]|jgi:L-aspartate oxidase|nr:L-aspartate oxidase [Propionibacteriaceae bacterium]
MSDQRINLSCPVVIGAGLAGLCAAIELSPVPCLVLTAGRLGESTSTGWAQGGIAAAVGEDDETELHALDTIAAGAGLCDPEAVRSIVAEAPTTVQWLATQGARFDRNPDGTIALGLEGAHSRHRIVHAKGDDSGAELLRTVAAKVATLPSVSVWERCRATEIIVEDGEVTGVYVEIQGKPPVELRTRQVILATGGAGGLYTYTTNPLTSRGQGLALAYAAGAELRDLEMVQFHPTGLDVNLDPMPLISEAVRGEGALVVDETGDKVILDPLSARDVVSRAEWAALVAGHRVYLDARNRPGSRFPRRFPAIFAICKAAGLDPRSELIPIQPAAHYHMGGVTVDENGRTNVPGLFAVGEVSSTGLHGANRLASNSLLEAAVCGRRAGRYLRWGPTHVLTGSDDFGAWFHRRTKRHQQDIAEVAPAQAREALRIPKVTAVGRERAEVDPIRQRLFADVGVLREGEALAQAVAALAGEEALVARLIAESALRRTESRGAHTRVDFPQTDEVAVHTVVQRETR